MGRKRDLPSIEEQTQAAIKALNDIQSNDTKRIGGVHMRNWLIEMRKKKALSQKQVATSCGISRQYYSFIESGERNVPVHTAKKIAEILGFDWQKFFE